MLEPETVDIQALSITEILEPAIAPGALPPPLLLNGNPVTLIALLEDILPIAVILPPPTTYPPVLMYHSLLMFALPVSIAPVQVPSS